MYPGFHPAILYLGTQMRVLHMLTMLFYPVHLPLLALLFFVLQVTLVLTPAATSWCASTSLAKRVLAGRSG
jgi:hypothetical protein